MTGAEVASLSPSAPTSASAPSPSGVSSAPLFSASLFPSAVVVLSQVFSALLNAGFLVLSVSVALSAVSSVPPSFEILFLSAFVETEDFHQKVEYSVHSVPNASVDTDVETSDIADRKHCLSEMSWW